MNILEALLRCARADLAYYRWWASHSTSPETWLDLAGKAQEQIDALELMLVAA